jgi:hypothetical protein
MTRAVVDDPLPSRQNEAPVAGPGEPGAVSSTGNNDEFGGVAEWRPADFSAVQECLTLLARAVRQFHTYPATSPLCIDAIAACQKALVGLTARDNLTFRVAPSEVIVDEVRTGAGTAIEHEVARRLHRAQVAGVEIARSATARDLTRLCSDLSAFGDAARSALSFAEVLTEHGVSGVTVRTAHRPEVLEVGAPSPPVRQLVEHERQRRQALFASGGPVQHLYPPDKGWVRVDPTANYDSFSLVDLAVLIDNPADVAVALMRLTGDESTGTVDPMNAFEQKFTDLATIFAAVDPRLSRLLFSKLSRAVLELDADRRGKLLRRTVLPGLLDGKLDGSVLADFPDVDLAEALCLLLDLETASPDVLGAALDRLGLPPERRRALGPLLEERLKRGNSAARADSYGHNHAIEHYARKLIEITGDHGRSFAEFTAFDLSVTDQTRETVAGLVRAIGRTDFMASQLETLFQLVRLEPNPSLVTAFMARVIACFETLERDQQRGMLAQWAERFRQLSVSLRPSRPDVADAIVTGLEGFCTLARALALADLYKADGKSRALAHALIDGFGETPLSSFVAALDDVTAHTAARPLVSLMSDHADLFAPVLAPRLAACGQLARPVLVRVLGAAGPACTSTVIDLLHQDDEATGREALRALAKIGTAQAAAAVADQVMGDKAWSQTAAEEALWHFPPNQAAGQVRRLLASPDFVRRHPDVAGRLLDRVAQVGASGLAPVLQTLTPLRFRFWNPALVRVALKARQLLRT